MCRHWHSGIGTVRDGYASLPGVVAGRTDLLPMVCGVREFVRPVREYFHGLGYDRRAVKWESYD